MAGDSRLLYELALAKLSSASRCLYTNSKPEHHDSTPGSTSATDGADDLQAACIKAYSLIARTLPCLQRLQKVISPQHETDSPGNFQDGSWVDCRAMSSAAAVTLIQLQRDNTAQWHSSCDGRLYRLCQSTASHGRVTGPLFCLRETSVVCTPNQEPGVSSSSTQSRTITSFTIPNDLPSGSSTQPTYCDRPNIPAQSHPEPDASGSAKPCTAQQFGRPVQPLPMSTTDTPLREARTPFQNIKGSANGLRHSSQQPRVPTQTQTQTNARTNIVHLQDWVCALAVCNSVVASDISLCNDPAISPSDFQKPGISFSRLSTPELICTAGAMSPCRQILGLEDSSGASELAGGASEAICDNLASDGQLPSNEGTTCGMAPCHQRASQIQDHGKGQRHVVPRHHALLKPSQYKALAEIAPDDTRSASHSATFPVSTSESFTPGSSQAKMLQLVSALAMCETQDGHVVFGCYEESPVNAQNGNASNQPPQVCDTMTPTCHVDSGIQPAVHSNTRTHGTINCMQHFLHPRDPATGQGDTKRARLDPPESGNTNELQHAFGQTGAAQDMLVCTGAGGDLPANGRTADRAADIQSDRGLQAEQSGIRDYSALKRGVLHIWFVPERDDNGFEGDVGWTPSDSRKRYASVCLHQLPAGQQVACLHVTRAFFGTVLCSVLTSCERLLVWIVNARVHDPADPTQVTMLGAIQAFAADSSDNMSYHTFPFGTSLIRVLCTRCTAHDSDKKLDLQVCVVGEHAAHAAVQNEMLTYQTSMGGHAVGLGLSRSTRVEGITCASILGDLLVYGTLSGEIAVWNVLNDDEVLVGTASNQVAGWRLSCGPVHLVSLFRVAAVLVCVAALGSDVIVSFEM